MSLPVHQLGVLNERADGLIGKLQFGAIEQILGDVSCKGEKSWKESILRRPCPFRRLAVFLPALACWILILVRRFLFPLHPSCQSNAKAWAWRVRLQLWLGSQWLHPTIFRVFQPDLALARTPRHCHRCHSATRLPIGCLKLSCKSWHCCDSVGGCESSKVDGNDRRDSQTL